MNYQIVGLCPRSDLALGRWGFCIKLHPNFKIAVQDSGINKVQAYTAIENMGRAWLDGCGFDRLFEYDGKKEPLYKPNQDLRISWGEWGLEHITVPGNACGLDIDTGIMSPRNGKILLPHNIDGMSQAVLLLIVFTWFAETIHNFAESISMEKR